MNITKPEFTKDFMFEVKAFLTSDERSKIELFDNNDIQDYFDMIDCERGTNFSDEWFELFDYLPITISDQLLDELAGTPEYDQINEQVNYYQITLTYIDDNFNKPLTEMQVGNIIQNKLLKNEFIIK